MSNDGFDPRFDPAFQRGYDGPAPTSVQKAPVQKVPVQKPIASRPAAVPVEQSRSFEDRQPVADREPRPSESFDFGVDIEETEVDAPRRPNPFLIALGAISVLLVGAGFYLVSRVQDLYADTQSSGFDFVTLQVLMQAVPVVIGLGLATGVGILFIFAIRWGKEH